MSQDESIHATCRPSSMYAIILTVLRSRITPLASFQRSISEYSLRSTKRVTVPRASGSEDFEAKGGHMELAVSEQTEAVNTGNGHAIQGRLPHDMPFSKPSPTQIGLQLLNAATVESQQSNPQSQAFSRQLYINGMVYLLQGLPPDLIEQEVLQLQSALPNSLDRSLHSDTAPQKRPNPSILHRSVETTVLFFCLLIRFALPYVKYFLALAYSYERTHHVTENAFALSIHSVNHFGKLGVNVVGMAMNNKPVMEVITYCVDGICGGLSEGLGEGIKAIGAQNES